MNLWYFVAWSWDDFASYIYKKYGYTVQDYNGQTGMCFMLEKTGEARIIIWLKHSDKPAIAAHEALHGANLILDRAGFKFSAHNDEPQAYLLTEIMETMGFR